MVGVGVSLPSILSVLEGPTVPGDTFPVSSFDCSTWNIFSASQLSNLALSSILDSQLLSAESRCLVLARRFAAFLAQFPRTLSALGNPSKRIPTTYSQRFEAFFAVFHAIPMRFEYITRRFRGISEAFRGAFERFFRATLS